MFEDASRHLEAQENLLYTSLEIPSYPQVTQKKCIFVIADESFQPRTLEESGMKVVRRHPCYGDPKWRAMISKETAKLKPDITVIVYKNMTDEEHADHSTHQWVSSLLRERKSVVLDSCGSSRWEGLEGIEGEETGMFCFTTVEVTFV